MRAFSQDTLNELQTLADEHWKRQYGAYLCRVCETDVETLDADLHMPICDTCKEEAS